MKAFAGAAWREIVTAYAFIGGAWRTLTVGKAYNSGQWRSAASFVLPMSLTITPSPCTTGGTGYFASRLMTATPTGGLAPFTYAWTLISGSVDINSPSTASTTVSGDVSYTSQSFTIQCTVTDSLGTTASAQDSGVLFNYSRDTGRYF